VLAATVGFFKNEIWFRFLGFFLFWGVLTHKMTPTMTAKSKHIHRCCVRRVLLKCYTNTVQILL